MGWGHNKFKGKKDWFLKGDKNRSYSKMDSSMNLVSQIHLTIVTYESM